MNTTKTSAATATPYCSVCHSAGKTKQEYTSHWIRASTAKDAKVTCPYLLSLVCGYCKQQGHTPKYCPVAHENNKQKSKTSASTYAKAPTPATTPARAKQQKNHFNALQHLIDDEEENALKTAEHIKSFPAINDSSSVAITGSNKNVLTGWASIAAKPKATAQTQASAKVDTTIAPAKTVLDWSEDWAKPPQRQNAVVVEEVKTKMLWSDM